MRGQRFLWSVELMPPIGIPVKQAVRSRGHMFIKGYSRGRHLGKQDRTEKLSCSVGPHNRLTRPPEGPGAS